MHRSKITLLVLSGFVAGFTFNFACGDSDAVSDAAVGADAGSCNCSQPVPFFSRVIEVHTTETKTAADDWSVGVTCPSSGIVPGRVVSAFCEFSPGVALAGFTARNESGGGCTWLRPSGPAQADLTARVLCYYPEGTPLPTLDGGQ